MLTIDEWREVAKGDRPVTNRVEELVTNWTT